MRKRTIALLAATAVATMISPAVRADSLATFGTPTNVTGPGGTTVTTTASGGGPGMGNTITNGTNDVVTAGTQVFGLNFSGQSGTSYPYDVNINGQNFLSFRDPGGNGTLASQTQGPITYTATGILNSYTMFGAPGAAAQSYGVYTPNCCGGPSPDYTLENGAYSNDSNGSFTFSGLTPNNTYELQFWVEDPRTCCNNRTETLSSGGATSGPLSYSVAGGDGQYVTATFVADGTGSQTFSLVGAGAGGGSAQANLLQLRDITSTVPEPASLGLLTLAAGALKVRRRRTA